MSVSLERIQLALAGIGQGFAADGYEMIVQGVSDGVLHVAIKAGPDACAECLVPAEIMRGMLHTALPENSGVTDIKIDYPRDAHARPQ